MTPSQTRAVAAIRQMIVRAAFLDLESETAKEEEISASKYEFADWRLDPGARGAVFLYVRTRMRDPRTVGYLFPRVFHFYVGRNGGIRELGTKGGAGGRRVGLRDYVMGR